MSSVKTDGIVLRYANYGESDRMLTLLTPAMGLVSVSARGCRKATSRRLTATELFAAGEYLLCQKGERYTLTSFQLGESYYPIREDVDKLSHGVYWLNLCEAASQPGEECGRLFKMLLLSLAVLAYGNLSCRPLTAVFLAQFAMLQGFAPMLGSCIHCGREPAAPMRFDVEGGGVCCAACAGHGLPMTEADLAWLREAQAHGAFVLAGRREFPEADPQAAEAPFAILRAHVEYRIEKHMASSKFL
ncbi:MAG: DNA repair protein RecO [Firmicutes bacterium]|nr:DNA repair protein RecO [Bacillota bacterium]